MLAIIANLSAFLIYLSGSVWLLLTLRQQQAARPTLLFGIGFAAIGFHGLGVYTLIVQTQGLNLSIDNMGSLILWTINTLVLFASLRKPLHNLLIFLFPLTALSLPISLLLPHQHSIGAVDTGIGLHILFSIVAYSLLAIASLQTLCWHWQNQQLRKHSLKGIARLLPPLQTMETLIFDLLWAGQLLLSCSLFIGFLYLENLFSQQLAHKTLLSVFSWLIFSALLWGRHTRGWRGNTAVKWVLSGFCLLMLAYFGTKLVLEVILK
ncbi:MAG: cytochrome c biogenesis protein CcsA [Cellvibrionaceae bacterium]|nr:cytochrome c biogenesis protein CcsA [Cellvibrionaceae bacterium]